MVTRAGMASTPLLKCRPLWRNGCDCTSSALRSRTDFPARSPLNRNCPSRQGRARSPRSRAVNRHCNFFALGYALEHFDALSLAHTNDQLGPVDATGAFTDGTSIWAWSISSKGFAEASDAARTTIVEKKPLVYASTGLVNVSSGSPETLVRARQTLRTTPNPRWSTRHCGCRRGVSDSDELRRGDWGVTLLHKVW